MEIKNIKHISLFFAIVSFLLIGCSKEGTNNLEIGDKHQGGTIFYFFKEGDIDFISGEVHGLVATEGLKTASGTYKLAHWGCFDTEINGADGESIGTGYQNTLDIIETCNESNIAARLCYDYSVEYEGVVYDDWYLPSSKELRVLYAIYTLGYGSHWSSTEYTKQSAISFWSDVDMGVLEHIESKTKHLRVIAIHSF